MSNDASKFKGSRRRYKTDVAIAKQVKIARSNSGNQTVIDQPHRLAKHHAMDCGDPGCCLCGNPRRNKMFKTKDRLTQQEKRLFQDPDATRERHSNGLKNEDDQSNQS